MCQLLSIFEKQSQIFEFGFLLAWIGSHEKKVHINIKLPI